jgi:glyoxylase-like metal-dependent hydrolase (beta-lactamase superfamily II)
MKELAPGVHHINCMPLPNAVNAYLLDDVLVDAGGRRHGSRIMKALKGHPVTAHALTHAHPDHQGASDEICTKLGIPYWVPEGDVDAAEDPSLIAKRQPQHKIAQFMDRIFTGPGHTVDRALTEGDTVGSFKVISTPGHSAGHVVYWRESDRVLVVGDVLCNQDSITGIPGLQLPKDFFTPDPARNRESAKTLGPLEPSLVVFGHGKPLRDTEKFVKFCAAL